MAYLWLTRVNFVQSNALWSEPDTPEAERVRLPSLRSSNQLLSTRAVRVCMCECEGVRRRRVISVIHMSATW